MKKLIKYKILIPFVVLIVILSNGKNSLGQRTSLDNFIKEYRSFRTGLFNFVGRTDTDATYMWNLRRKVSLF